MTKEEKELNRIARQLDANGNLKALYELRKNCKHRMVGTFDGFDRCEICGQPGEWEAR